MLVVEDDQPTAYLIQKAFAESKSQVRWNVSLARDGQEALDHLFDRLGHSQSPLPDLVLLDWSLPEVGGSQILRQIKTSQTLRMVPVLVFSSSVDEGVVQSAYDGCANAFISKPSDIDGFSRVVETIATFWVHTARLPALEMIPEATRPLPPASLLRHADFYRMQVRDLRTYAMFVLDPEGIVRSWNAGVENLLGYTEEEWLGQHASAIFTPHDKAVEMCESEMRLAQETGSATDIRWHRHKSGAEFFANGFMNALRDEHGTLIGYAKIMSDETTRKQLQDSLTESNTALEQFAYVASHDLQEPLRTMRVYAQMLAQKYSDQLDAQASEFLATIVSASGRMSTLILDLLAYARLTTEVERPSSAALDEDLEAALTHLSQSIEESGAQVTHDPMPTLAVDRGQMVRLFQNLIGNAVKYRHPTRQPIVHVSAEQKGSEWVIAVRDNGIGFDPKYASEIFAPFKRLHGSDEYSGTGVGLAICARIARAQGGRIWAESQPGEGSTFFLALPVDSLEPPTHTPPIAGLSETIVPPAPPAIAT